MAVRRGGDQSAEAARAAGPGSAERLYFHFPTSCPRGRTPRSAPPPPATHTNKPPPPAPAGPAAPNPGRRERAGAAVHLCAPRDRAGPRGTAPGRVPGEPAAPSPPPRPHSVLPGRRLRDPDGARRSPRPRAGLPLGLRLQLDAALRPPPPHAGTSGTARQPRRPPRRSRRRRRRPSPARRVPAAARISRRPRPAAALRPALPPPHAVVGPLNAGARSANRPGRRPSGTPRRLGAPPGRRSRRVTSGGGAAGAAPRGPSRGRPAGCAGPGLRAGVCSGRAPLAPSPLSALRCARRGPEPSAAAGTRGRLPAQPSPRGEDGQAGPPPLSRPRARSRAPQTLDGS